MGTEARRNGKVYYYQKRREGDRVISQYIGGGLVADFAEKRAAMQRTNREAEREQLKAERMSMAEIDTALNEFSQTVDTLMTAELLLSGYYQHKRQWRRRRNG